MIICWMIVGLLVGVKITTDGRKSFKNWMFKELQDDKDLSKDIDECGLQPKIMFSSAVVFLSLFFWPLIMKAMPDDH